MGAIPSVNPSYFFAGGSVFLYYQYVCMCNVGFRSDNIKATLYFTTCTLADFLKGETFLSSTAAAGTIVKNT